MRRGVCTALVCIVLLVAGPAQATRANVFRQLLQLGGIPTDLAGVTISGQATPPTASTTPASATPTTGTAGTPVTSTASAPLPDFASSALAALGGAASGSSSAASNGTAAAPSGTAAAATPSGSAGLPTFNFNLSQSAPVEYIPVNTTTNVDLEIRAHPMNWANSLRNPGAIGLAIAQLLNISPADVTLGNVTRTPVPEPAPGQKKYPSVSWDVDVTVNLPANVSYSTAQGVLRQASGDGQGLLRQLTDQNGQGSLRFLFIYAINTAPLNVPLPVAKFLNGYIPPNPRQAEIELIGKSITGGVLGALLVFTVIGLTIRIKWLRHNAYKEQHEAKSLIN